MRIWEGKTMQLEAIGIVSGYGKSEVLHGIDFCIGDGDIVAVLGPNGAGKTTLMRTLACTIPVMRGTLRLDNKSMHKWRPYQAVRAGIGYVPQTGNVFGELSVDENLSLAGGRHQREILKEIFGRFPILHERSQQAAGSLSGGERQALAVAMAVLARPQILLLDEPTTGLSPLASASLTEWIIDIAATGVSVVWIVEQNPEPVLSAAKTAHVLTDGEFKYSGPANEISGDRALEIAFE